MRGSLWYHQSHLYIARTWPGDVETAVAVVAATSINASVKANLTHAHRILSGGRIDTLVPAAQAEVARALRGEPLNGPKVEPFRRALLLDEDAVPVDRWMFRAFCLAPNKGNREKIERRIRSLATLHGLTPARMQAVLWCGILTQHNRNPEPYGG